MSYLDPDVELLKDDEEIDILKLALEELRSIFTHHQSLLSNKSAELEQVKAICEEWKDANIDCGIEILKLQADLKQVKAEQDTLQAENASMRRALEGDGGVYEGTRQDWIDRAFMAEHKVEKLEAELLNTTLLKAGHYWLGLHEEIATLKVQLELEKDHRYIANRELSTCRASLADLEKRQQWHAMLKED